MTYAELFAGVSGMGMGFDEAGMTCRWRVEWDESAAGVLAYHSPKTPLFSDVVAFVAWLRRQRKTLSKTKFNELCDELRTDILGGGSPCQDLSLAGKRKGLDGERSGLFRVMVRICRILRIRLVVWENVYGALSSNEGRDFAAVIGAFTGCIPGVPDDGWGNAGFARAAAPDRWNVAWRVFDSQFFGVPQRRRRVFLVASLGDGSCAEILFESESVRGDNPPSRRTGESVAGTLTRSALDGSSACGGDGRDSFMIAAEVAPTLNAAFGSKQGLENQHIDGGGDYLSHAIAGTLCSRDNKGARIDADTNHLILTRQGGFPSSADVAGTLTGGSRKNGGYSADDVPMVAGTLGANHGQPRAEHAWTGQLITHTLRGEGHDASEDGTGRGVPLVSGPVVFNWQAAGNQTTLGASEDSAACLSVSTTQAVSCHIGVRRLTPRECERLQGWPDDHTRFRRELTQRNNRWFVVDGLAVEQADGPRYKQAGNGITRNVSAWIGSRIVKFSK